MLPTGSNPYQAPVPANNQYQEIPEANTNEYHLPPTNSQYHPVMSTASNNHLGIPTSSIVTNPSVSCQQQLQQPSLLQTALSQAKLIQSQKAATVQNQTAMGHQLSSSGGQRRNSSLVVEDVNHDLDASQGMMIVCLKDLYLFFNFLMIYFRNKPQFNAIVFSSLFMLL